MRIVIVDSEAAMREKIKNIAVKAEKDHILKSGCDLVGEAADGRAAFDLIKSTRPDLVIMELMLPRLDGIPLLKQIRAEKIHSRVIIITNEKDFDRVREVIALGIDEYLIKPVEESKVEDALRTVEDKLVEELVVGNALSVENIFMSYLNGRVYSEQIIDEVTYGKHGFTMKDPGSLFVVWLGAGYTEQREMVQRILENQGRFQPFSLCVLPIAEWRLLIAIIYETEGDCLDYAKKDRTKEEKQKEWYDLCKKNFVHSLNGSVRGELVCLWSDTEELGNMKVSLETLRSIREWNLVFDRGEVIRKRDVEELEIVPMKYPAELEQNVRQMVLNNNRKEIIKCYFILYDHCRRDPHSPAQIKELFIRFNMAVVSAYKMKNEVTSELQIQRVMQDIAQAMSWGEMRTAIENFFHALNFYTDENEHEQQWSPLIQKAYQTVKKYYDQGITLELLAGKLFVSEEYLSSQFKKETGMGFKETVKALQLERIKELLIDTSLKLNQIAELAGYSDPKYMSRVFKDEVGMLPSEYRKSAQ